MINRMIIVNHYCHRRRYKAFDLLIILVISANDIYDNDSTETFSHHALNQKSFQ